MAIPLDAIRAIHNAFWKDMAVKDSAAYNAAQSAPVFAGVTNLIHTAMEDDWKELTRRIPEIR
jgi:hypothetical protein